jgi:hypothetical protein
VSEPVGVCRREGKADEGQWANAAPAAFARCAICDLLKEETERSLPDYGWKGKSGDHGAGNRQESGRDAIKDDFIEGYCSRYS